MNRIILGLLCGLGLGILELLLMIPLAFESSRKKIEAMAGACIERFSFGQIEMNTSAEYHLSLALASLVGSGYIGLGKNWLSMNTVNVGYF